MAEISIVATKLKLLREVNGLSAEQVATSIGKTQSIITKYEKDMVHMRLDILTDYCRVFKIPSHALFDDVSIAEFKKMIINPLDYETKYKTLEDEIIEIVSEKLGFEVTVENAMKYLRKSI